MTDEAIDLTTDEEIDAAIAEADAAPDRPVAVSAKYNAEFDMIVIALDNGQRLLIPREQMQGLEAATESQLAKIEITAGVDIGWPEINVNHYLPYLIEGKYATEKWKLQRLQNAVAA